MGMERMRILGFAGSLRRASYNRGLIRAAAELAPGGITVEVFDLADLPLYNQDVEDSGEPASVVAFKRAISEADALLVATPEYNHGVPGVLKNALDWASRPSGKSVLQNKPVLIISNSPGFTGGVRAQAQINETLLSVSAVILPGRQIVIGGVADKIKDGKFADKTNLAFALAAIHRLVDLCRRVVAA
jgi:chromate reductase